MTVSTPKGLTGYQQLLVDSASAAGGSCSGVPVDYFSRLNAPVATEY